MKVITSRDNPRLKALRALAADARRQRDEGRTLLDGPHLLKAFTAAGGMPDLLLVSESGYGRPEIAAILSALPEVETLLLRDSLFREISGISSPVGLLAQIPVPPESPLPLLESCVLLDGVQDAGNVGTILRTAAAAGIHDVALGPGCAGAWTPRVLRAGQGAHFGLSIREHANLAAIVDAFPGKVAATVAHEGHSLYAVDLTGNVAWMFGSEGAGLSEDLLARAGLRVCIPMALGCESLNVAAAAAVCLFEMVRQKAVRGG